MANFATIHRKRHGIAIRPRAQEAQSKTGDAWWTKVPRNGFTRYAQQVFKPKQSSESVDKGM